MKGWLMMLIVIITINIDSVSQQLDNSTTFKEGIYLSFDEVKLNNPKYSIDQVDLVVGGSSSSFELHLIKLKFLDDSTKVKFSNIWAVGLKGKIFINYRGNGTWLEAGSNYSVKNPLHGPILNGGRNVIKLTRPSFLGNISIMLLAGNDKVRGRDYFKKKIIKFETGEIL